MARLLLLTNSAGASADVVPALALLQHKVKILPLEASVLVEPPVVDCLLIDARRELPNAKSFTKLITSTGVDVPIIVITTEGGLSAIDARIRIVIGQSTIDNLANDPSIREIKSGEVIIDESSYTAKVKGRVLDLTFKEFELLKYLAQHPGRVFTRSQLLQEIWGYDYFGGTRTVDVHIRRLRSKLGPEFEAIIGTVRNVGYRFAAPNNQASANIN
jgi:DNA-binding winged helix-turn-helix (wHTH) protein